jgi:8-oxo-dGTP pyrophosphatase MutT (NUDIX family)
VSSDPWPDDYKEEQRRNRPRRAFSSSVFIYYDKKVLLVRHKLLGLWLPVGGEREGDETPLETARREAHEETGLELKFPRIRHAPAGTPPGFLGYEEHEAGPKGYHMNFCFLAYTSSNTLKSDGSWDQHRWVEPIGIQGDKNDGIPENVLDMVWQVGLTPLALPEELV